MHRFVDGQRRRTIELAARDRPTEDGGDRDYAWELTIVADARQHHRFHEDDAAFVAFHRAIASAYADGLALEIDGEPAVATAAQFACLPELEARVDHDLDDDAAWLALGEAWARARDPRGDCVLADRAQQGLTDPAEFLARRKAATAARRARAGLVYAPLGRDGYRQANRWRHGLIDTIVLQCEGHAPGRTTGELIDVALANPFARFVRALHVRAGDRIIEGLAAAAARCVAGGAGSLRELELDFDGEPELERLADVELPRLARLVIRGTITATQLDAIATWVARQPAIADVELWTAGIIVQDDTAVLAAGGRWLDDATRWPASLRRLACDGRIAAR